MSTSLDASTLTPGSTAPDASLTTPAIALCACAAAGSTRNRRAMNTGAAIAFLHMPILRVPAEAGPASRMKGSDCEDESTVTSWRPTERDSGGADGAKRCELQGGREL